MEEKKKTGEYYYSDAALGQFFGTCLILGIIGFFVWLVIKFVLPDEWRIKYSLLYLAPVAQVYIEDRPTSCDWGHAPLGDKACHYEKTVSKTLWEKSTTGNPIVSYNDGKSWYPGTPEAGIKLPTKYVNVNWQRKNDP